MKKNKKKEDASVIKSAAELALEKAGQEELDDLPEVEIGESPKTIDPEDESFREKYLRTRADLENIQRRMREEREHMRLNTLCNFIRELLPFIDNLDRALAAAKDDPSDLAKGLRMTRTLLDQVFSNNNIQKIATEGIFDPKFHEAISQIEDPELSENTIKNVIEEGYLIGERVIRHSKVQVSSGGPAPEKKSDTSSKPQETEVDSN
jgi:molecular chaperone GrpE